MSDAALLIADEALTEARLPFDALIGALETGFRTGCVVPVRHQHVIQTRAEPWATIVLMPAWSRSQDDRRYVGTKIVTVFPGNLGRGQSSLNSTYLLYDGDTGRQVAMLDGNVLTSRRTAATSALAARYLARADASRLLVIGSGRVGSQLADAYAAVRPLSRIEIWDVDGAGAARLAARLSARGRPASVAADLEQAVRSADMVTAATLSTLSLIRGAWLRPGTHVDLIGGFKPEMREADDEAILRARVFVDRREAFHEAGDLTQPLEAGLIAETDVITLTELVTGERSGRRDDDEITLFKAVGSGLADLFAARLVYETDN